MGIPPGVPVKAAKSIGPCPSYCRADCPGTQRPAHPPGACPGVPAAWLRAAALRSYGKYSLSETDVLRSTNDANGGTNRGSRHQGQATAIRCFCLYRAKNLTVAITSVVLGLLTASARWAPLIAPPHDDHAIDARTVGAKPRDFPVHGRFRAYDAPRGR